MIVPTACLLAALLLQEAPAGGDTPSALWGRAGELASPAGRLPDFSWAGYRWGAALPVPPVSANVRDFGAKGDGEADDTAAFAKALAAAPEGAILVPAGRYLIGDLLTLDRSRIVLRGEGPRRSVLVFRRPLNEIRPNWGATTTGQKTSNYSWGGGFLLLRGGSKGRPLGSPAGPVPRGSRELRLALPPASLKAGDVVEIRQSDEAGRLASHLYGGQPGSISRIGRIRTSFISPVAAVEGTLVTLARPLRTDLDPAWSPEVRSFEPDVVDSGVEHLGFEFPATPYGGHFSEAGWNPLAFQGVAHCWGRDLVVVNGDSGPYLGGAFCTLQGIVLESSRPPDRAGLDGHHGITAYGNDNRVEDFEIRRKYVHDLTVEHSAGNVFRRGRAADLALDHHKKAPHANLFTDLDAGEGTRFYRSGGGADLGLHCGAWGTFWNIRARRPLPPPPAGFGPGLLNFVGLASNLPSSTDPQGRWWEAIPPARLLPSDLYQAQRVAREGRAGPR